MWSQVLFLVLTTVIGVSSDVIRSVYCQNQCTDYLKISESHMPSCETDFATINFCGTVISCDIADATKYQNRPLMNSTEHPCCYVTEVKEHGDCDPREVIAPNAVVQILQETHHVTSSSACGEASVAWLVALILLVVVIIESSYIFYHLFFRQSHQKISQFCEDQFVNRPVVLTRPLINPQYHCQA